MRAPLASTTGTFSLFAFRSAIGTPASAARSPPLVAQNRESGLRRAFDDFKKGARRTTWRTLTLFPVAHRFDRHADLSCESCLCQPGSPADITGISCINETIRAVGAWDRLTVGKRNGLLAAVGQDFDQASVGFQSHPKHGAGSSVLWLRE